MDALAAESRLRGICMRKAERFIAAQENLPNWSTRFDEALYGRLAERLTVCAMDDLRFKATLQGGDYDRPIIISLALLRGCFFAFRGWKNMTNCVIIMKK